MRVTVQKQLELGKGNGRDGAIPQQPLSLRSHTFPAALGSCPHSHRQAPLLVRLNKMFLPSPFGRTCLQQFHSLSPFPLMAEARLPSCTWPPRREEENPLLLLPTLNPGQGGLEALPCLWSHTAAGGSSCWQLWAASAVGSGRRYEQPRSQTAPSLQVRFQRLEIALGRQLQNATTLPPAQLCSRSTWAPATFDSAVAVLPLILSAASATP